MSTLSHSVTSKVEHLWTPTCLHNFLDQSIILYKICIHLLKYHFSMIQKCTCSEYKTAQVLAGGQCPRTAPLPSVKYTSSPRVFRASVRCVRRWARHLFSDSTCTDLKGLRIRTERRRLTFGLLGVNHLSGSFGKSYAHSEWHFAWRQRSLRKLSVLYCVVCVVFHVSTHHSEVVWLTRVPVKCPGSGFGWSIRWMQRKENPFCVNRERGQYEVSQKVEFRSDHLDYLPRDDSFFSSLVFISNSGGPVYNNRPDGYGGGRCSFKPIL